MTPGDVRSIYASGTAYTLTNTATALDFGTTDPSVVLNAPGTWLMFGRVTVQNTGATFAANRAYTFKLRRTNNTAADVTGATTTQSTDIVTTETITYTVTIPPALYTTTADSNNDAITIFGSVATVPSAGTFDVTEASIIALKIC
ncbi:hypothetical protein KW791_00510 [Candidatus Parcubacteria bacterium]|nr:hypothetical protein [Candidatus Parcubacteria bacterium]